MKVLKRKKVTNNSVWFFAHNSSHIYVYIQKILSEIIRLLLSFRCLSLSWSSSPFFFSFLFAFSYSDRFDDFITDDDDNNVKNV